MFLFACPIITRNQCGYLPTGQISVYAPRIQPPVSAQWSQRLYVKVEGKMKGFQHFQK